MRLWFLPYVREGFRPGADRASDTVPWRALGLVKTRLSAPNQPHRDIDTRFELLGPGDVIGFDENQVLRVLPARGANSAETDYFPAIELDRPDLPWAYSPLPAAAEHRVKPWMCLVVLEDRGVEVLPGQRDQGSQRAQSPWILNFDPGVAARELPDLSEAWAWAHVQVTCETQADIEATLTGQADRTLARLLSPRRLLAHKRYVAAVVPTFLAGRIAGLGGDPEENARQTDRRPAWSSADMPDQLPAYFVWRFATGEAGDAESMVRRLRPKPIDPEARTRMRVTLSGADAGGDMRWESPLHLLAQLEPNPAPAPVLDGLRAALSPAADGMPVVGPLFLGEGWRPGRSLENLGYWQPTLNLSPMWRAAASLGAETVRANQEALVAAVWTELDARRAERQRARITQLSVAIENRVKARLTLAPDEEVSRVLAPLVVRAQPSTPSVGLRTSAGRRMTHKAWRLPRPTPAVTTRFSGPIDMPPPPLADRAFLAPGVADEPGGPLSPRFARPMGEVFARRYPELLLPSAQAIEPDTIMALDLDRRFVEAFLLGASDELNRELLWRGLPVDRNATPFRRFWDRVDGSDDIPPISQWVDRAWLGANARPLSGGVIIRSELVRRCPSLLIAAVPAGPQGPDLDNPSRMKLPVTRTSIGDDTVFISFAGLSVEEMIGGGSSRGWFLMFAENPVDPRFGLDSAQSEPPVSRATLSWADLGGAADAPYATASVFPSLTERARGSEPEFTFAYATANAASFTFLLQQRQFRAFLHGSVLARR